MSAVYDHMAWLSCADCMCANMLLTHMVMCETMYFQKQQGFVFSCWRAQEKWCHSFKLKIVCAFITFCVTTEHDDYIKKFSDQRL